MSVVDNLRIPLLYGHGAPVTLDAGRVTEEAMEILGQVGLAAKARSMSGGLTQVDMRKLELARAIAAKPRLLIADEAMAGLSTSEVDEILALLLGMKEQRRRGDHDRARDARGDALLRAHRGAGRGPQDRRRATRSRSWRSPTW